MEVKELAEMTMEELIAEYNEWAITHEKPVVESFKSLRAARAAVQATRVTDDVNPADIANAVEGKVKDQKYTSTDKRGPTQGVGKRAKELLLEGKTVKETLELVKTEFPTSNTNMNCINFYRAALVRDGLIPRTRVEGPVTIETLNEKLEAAKKLVANLEAQIAKAAEKQIEQQPEEQAA